MSVLKAYQDIAHYSEVLGATPHRKIQLLFNKLAEDIDIVIQAIEVQDIPKKCKFISNAHHIVSFLRSLLSEDPSSRDEFEHKLEDIYARLENQLLIANMKNDLSALSECRQIVKNLNQWWDNVEL